MFGKSVKDKLIEFMKDKDWVTLDDITLGIDLSRTKTKQGLFQLKYKKLVEKDDNDNWKLLAVRPVAHVQTPEKTTDLSSLPSLPGDEQVPQQEENIETNSSSLSHEISDMKTKLDLVLGVKQKKEKKARLKKLNKNKVKRYNKGKNRACIMLSRNQGARLIQGEYLNGMIKAEGKFFDAGAYYTWIWEGKQPIYILKDFSIRPLAVSDEYEKAVREKTLIDSQVLTVQAMKQIEADSSDEGAKKKPNVMMFVGIAIAAIIVIYLFMGGKK